MSTTRPTRPRGPSWWKKYFERKWIFDMFWDFMIFWPFLTIFWFFWLWRSFGFFKDFYGFFGFVLDFFFNFLIFLIFFKLFLNFLNAYIFFRIPFKVTKVTTKSFQGYYWAPKIAKVGQNSIISSLYLPKGQKKGLVEALRIRRS